MQPLIHDGDVVLVEPCDPGSIRLADVVLFKNNHGMAVLHRVIGKHQENGEYFFILQGDQAPHTDGVIPQTEILGKLVGLERHDMHINMSQLSLRILGWGAVLRSKLGKNWAKPALWMTKAARRTGVFRKYLN